MLKSEARNNRLLLGFTNPIVVGSSVVASIAGVVVGALALGVAGVNTALITLGVLPVVVGEGLTAIFASDVAERVFMYEDPLSPRAQRNWQRVGAGLMAAFTFASAGGVGVLINQYLPTTTPTTSSFNDKSGQQDTSVIVVANSQASGLPQAERVLALA